MWASFRVKLLPQRSGSKASTGKFPTNGTHQGDIQFSLSLSGHSATHYVKHEGKSIKRITVQCCFLQCISELTDCERTLTFFDTRKQ